MAPPEVPKAVRLEPLKAAPLEALKGVRLGVRKMHSKEVQQEVLKEGPQGAQ